MSPIVMHALAVFTALIGLVALEHVVTNRSFTNLLFYLIGAAELAAVGMLISGLAALPSSGGSTQVGLVISYLVTIVIIPPVAVIWGVAEKSRWGTGVVAVALFSVAVLCERLVQLWAA